MYVDMLTFEMLEYFEKEQMYMNISSFNSCVMPSAKQEDFVTSYSHQELARDYTQQVVSWHLYLELSSLALLAAIIH